MTTYISRFTTKKEFKAAMDDALTAQAVILHDPSIQPGSRSGSIRELFGWGITFFIVTNIKRSWFAEVTQGKNGKAVVK